MGLIPMETVRRFIQTEVSKMINKFVTDEGGLAREMIAGEDLVRGECVSPKSSGASREVVKNPVDSDTPVGIVYASASRGDIVRVVFAGTAYVLPEAAVTATIRYVMYSSGSEAGRAGLSAGIPGTTQHWREFGHCLESGSGAGALFLAVIHCN